MKTENQKSRNTHSETKNDWLRKAPFLKMLFVWIAIMCSALGGWAQSGNSCDSAKSFMPHQYGIPAIETISNNNSWYRFTNKTAKTKILIRIYNAYINRNLTKISLFEGNCANAVLKAELDLSSNNDSILTITSDSLSINSNCYLKLEKSPNTNPNFISVVTIFEKQLVENCQNLEAAPCDLITNGGFETITDCPQGVNFPSPDNVGMACNWNSTDSNSPELFAECNNNISQEVGVPLNNWGTQNSHTTSTLNYGGFYAAYDRVIGGAQFVGDEKIEVGLNSALQVNKTYLFRSYMSLAESSNHRSEITIGTTDLPFINGPNENYVLTIPSIIDDDNWRFVDGCFTINNLSQNHSFLIIRGGVMDYQSSNPHFDSNYSNSEYSSFIGPEPIRFYHAFYYLDDVSLVQLANAGDDQIVTCQNQVMLGACPIDGASYSWWPSNGLNCTNCANPMASPNATTNYVVTVTYTDFNGNTTTATDDVTVTVPLIAAPIIVGEGTACVLNTPITYTVVNFNSGNVYQQPVVVNGTSTAINSTGEFTVTWDTNNGTNPIYNGGSITLSYINDYGCQSATQTFTVYPCCGYGELVTFFYNQSASQVSNINGGTVFINGTFTVDQNFSFNNCTVKMGAGAKIIVLSNNQLDIIGTRVHAGCNVMWDKIQIEANATLDVNKSLIEDADSAIVSDWGGNFKLFSSTLNKNLNHIKVHDYYSNHQATIVQCKLLCSNLSASNFSGTHVSNATLITPYTGKRTQIGLEIRNNVSMTIGDGSSVSYQNLWRNMDIGIKHYKTKLYEMNTSLGIYNNYFLNIDNPNTNFPQCKDCAYKCPKGTAICSYGNYKTTTTIDMGGSDILRRNIFSYCNIGLSAFLNHSVVAEKNWFSNVSDKGMYIAFSPKSFFDLKLNTFDNVNMGIDMYENYNTSPYNFNITSNLFNSIVYTHPMQPKVANFAIMVQNVNAMSSFANITGNTINDARNGIWLYNSDKNDVSNNFIYYSNNVIVPNAKLYGIRLQYCKSNVVNNNTIKKLSTTAPTASQETVLRGISIERSQLCTVAKNNLIRMGQGIRAYFNCSNATLACNKLNTCYVGFRFDGATISDQLPGSTPTANEWINMNFRRLKGTLAINTKWYWENGAGFNYVLNPTQWTFPNFFNPLPTTKTNDCGQYYFQLSDDEKREAMFGKVVNNEAEYDSTLVALEDYRTYDEKMLYESIKTDSTLLSLGTADDSAYQYFYDSIKYSSIGKYDEVKDSIISGNAEEAKALNDAVVNQDAMDNNRNLVNKIYLSTYAEGIYYFDSIQEAQLTALAYLDPGVDGDAVYSARAMLRIEPDVVETRALENQDNTITENKPSTQQSFVLFPNPNNGSMTLKYVLNEKEEGLFIIYDIVGKHIAKYNLQGGNKDLEISENNLSNGIYFYQIIMNEHCLSSGKIVIIK
jgi:parallel beta-helix repeat protein